jgi:hypothetical protein
MFQVDSHTTSAILLHIILVLYCCTRATSAILLHTCYYTAMVQVDSHTTTAIYLSAYCYMCALIRVYVCAQSHLLQQLVCKYEGTHIAV